MAAEQFQVFLDDLSILVPFQPTFWDGHGIETVLAALTYDLQRQLDQGGSALLLL